MKKTSLLLFCILIYCSAFGQDNKLIYTEVITVDSSLKQNDLFGSARAWFNKYFVSSKEVLQIQDKESGELSGKGIIKYSSRIFLGSASTAGTIRFTINVFVKDGKYKYEFTDFIHTASPSSFGLITKEYDPNFKCANTSGKGWQVKVYNDIKDQIDENVKPLISSLKEAMTKKVNSDW